MKPYFVWLFITFYILSASSADHVRSKRDLARIQSIIQWLIGLNEKKIIQTIPVIENAKKIYTMPAYENILLRALPQMEINSNVKHVFTEGLYPRKTYMPVQTIRNQYPVSYNNYYPPAMQEYIRVKDREYGIPPYTINQVAYQGTVPHLCQVGVINQEPCNYVSPAIITGNQPLPQPPIHIQNRMDIIDNPIPPVSFREEVALPPSTLRKVAYMNMIKEVTTTEEPVKIVEEIKPTILKLTPEVDIDAQSVMTPEIGIRKRVTFAAPVHTKYKYKMIYHNQPLKDTVVEMDTSSSDIISQTIKPKEETMTLAVKESTEKSNNSAALELNKMSAKSVELSDIEESLPKADKNSLQPSKSDDHIAAASENIPIVVMDDTQFANSGNKEKRPKVIIKRRRLKSRPENDRGDIPIITF